MVPDSFKIDLRGFAMPTPSRNITSRYGYRASFRRMHKGLDIKVYTGDTIVAAFDGKVRVARYDAGGYGYYIVVRHNNGLETIYGHLSKHLVTANQEVKAGEPIGLGGNTGHSFGSHLHFETRLSGEAIDPQLLFDFPNQDVTGDFYVFHKSENRNNNSRLAGNAANNANSTTAAAKRQEGSHFYQVKNGDTLTSIAKKLGINVSTLCSNNNLQKNSKIRPKQILKY
jgi:murein DD-endopeptidase MepM/ murein hydrolase activator NlpD